DSPRRPHEERPVSIPFLAAPRDGRSDSGLGIPAFRNNGESRRVLACAAVAGDGWDERMAMAGWVGWSDHIFRGRIFRGIPARPQGTAGLFDDQPSRIDHALDGTR